LIAAACVNEAVKIGTYCSHPVENYMMYMGQTSIYTNTFQYEKNPVTYSLFNFQSSPGLLCLFWQNSQKDHIKKHEVTRLPSIVLHFSIYHIFNSLKEDPVFLLQNPTINSSDGLLYIPKPLHLEEAHHYKLELTFQYFQFVLYLIIF
jgi:hypothetical protein